MLIGKSVLQSVAMAKTTVTTIQYEVSTIVYLKYWHLDDLMTVAPSVSLAAITSNRLSLQLSCSQELSLVIRSSLSNATTRILALDIRANH